MEEKKLSIILPAYNEEQIIGPLIRQLRELHPEAEVVVIDDGSTDDTALTARREGAIVYRHPYNIGNGAAVKSGIREATGELLVFMDADGQHDPADVRRLVGYLAEYDMAVGARTKEGQASFGRAIGNRVYNMFASYVAKFPIQDLTSGFRAVKADIAREFLYLLPNTYSYPTTLTLGVLRTGRSLVYVPIQTRKRKKGKSKIKFFRDGTRFFMIIIRICTFYAPMRVFLPASFATFLMGLINYAITYFAQGRFTNMSALLFVTAVLIFMMSLISEQICQLRFERRERRVPLQAVDRRESPPPGNGAAEGDGGCP
jgi:glycosyltransferase involved in cell wall biosynthesis